MKRVFLLIISSILFSLNLFAAKVSSNRNEFDLLLEQKQIEEKKEMEVVVYDTLYHKFVSKQIPEKFVEPFVSFTNVRKDLGIELIGIGYWESDWRVFVGKINANGSRDRGPLMLNELNLENQWFMEQFAKNCYKYKDDIDIFYMTICINFWFSLRSEHGPFNALQAYNGGPRVLRSDVSKTLKSAVVSYANNVYKYINPISKEWISYYTSPQEVMKVKYALLNERMKEERQILENVLYKYDTDITHICRTIRGNKSGLLLIFKKIRVKTIISFEERVIFNSIKIPVNI